MKSLFILAAVILLAACGTENKEVITEPKPDYTNYFVNHLDKEAKQMQDELAKLEAMPGMEEEKRVTRINTAIGLKLALLGMLLDEQGVYADKYLKSMPEEEKIKFKEAIKYDSIEGALDKIVQENKK